MENGPYKSLPSLVGDRPLFWGFDALCHAKWSEIDQYLNSTNGMKNVFWQIGADMSSFYHKPWLYDLVSYFAWVISLLHVLFFALAKSDT